jgi:hypothetical protein
MDASFRSVPIVKGLQQPIRGDAADVMTGRLTAYFGEKAPHSSAETGLYASFPFYRRRGPLLV